MSKGHLINEALVLSLFSFPFKTDLGVKPLERRIRAEFIQDLSVGGTESKEFLKLQRPEADLKFSVGPVYIFSDVLFCYSFGIAYLHNIVRW